MTDSPFGHPEDRAKYTMNAGKILIVDDEAQNLELLRSMLQSAGWDVITASNGRDALESVQSSKPNAIVLDMIMPEMDGFQVARSLKSHPDYRCIPIVAATSLSSRADRQRCFAAGCDEFMAKPFTAGRLQQLLLSLTLSDQAIRMADASVGNFPSGRAHK